jgi:hypothetical protein
MGRRCHDEQLLAITEAITNVTGGSRPHLDTDVALQLRAERYRSLSRPIPATSTARHHRRYRGVTLAPRVVQMNWPGAGWAGDPVVVVEYCSAAGDGSTVDLRVAQPGRAVEGDEAVATGVVASPHRRGWGGHADTGEVTHKSSHDIGEPARESKHKVK